MENRIITNMLYVQFHVTFLVKYDIITAGLTLPACAVDTLYI